MFCLFIIIFLGVIGLMLLFAKDEERQLRALELEAERTEARQAHRLRVASTTSYVPVSPQ